SEWRSRLIMKRGLKLNYLIFTALALGAMGCGQAATRENATPQPTETDGSPSASDDSGGAVTPPDRDAGSLPAKDSSVVEGKDAGGNTMGVDARADARADGPANASKETATDMNVGETCDNAQVLSVPAAGPLFLADESTVDYHNDLGKAPKCVGMDGRDH